MNAQRHLYLAPEPGPDLDIVPTPLIVDRDQVATEFKHRHTRSPEVQAQFLDDLYGLMSVVDQQREQTGNAWGEDIIIEGLFNALNFYRTRYPDYRDVPITDASPRTPLSALETLRSRLAQTYNDHEDNLLETPRFLRRDEA